MITIYFEGLFYHFCVFLNQLSSTLIANKELARKSHEKDENMIPPHTLFNLHYYTLFATTNTKISKQKIITRMRYLYT